MKRISTSVPVRHMRSRPFRAPNSALAGVFAILLAAAPANAFDQRYPELLRLALACPEAPTVQNEDGNTITSSTTYSFIDEGRNFSIILEKTYSVVGSKSKILKEKDVSTGSYSNIGSANVEGNEFDIQCKHDSDCVTRKMVSVCEFKDCEDGEIYDLTGKTYGASAVLCDEESAKNAKEAFELLMRERR